MTFGTHLVHTCCPDIQTGVRLLISAAPVFTAVTPPTPTSVQLKAVKSVPVQQSACLVSRVHTLILQGWILFNYSPVDGHTVHHHVSHGKHSYVLTSLPLETILPSPTSPTVHHSTPRLSHVDWHLPGDTFPLKQALPNINNHAIVSVPLKLSKLNDDFGCHSVQCCMNQTRKQMSRNALQALPWNLHVVTAAYCQFKRWSLKAL